MNNARTIQKIWNLSHDLLSLASASSSEQRMLAIQQLLAQRGSLEESQVVNRRWDPLFTRPFSSVRPSVGATTTDSRWVFGRRSSDFLIPVAALRILSISFSPMDPMLRPFSRSSSSFSSSPRAGLRLTADCTPSSSHSETWGPNEDVSSRPTLVHGRAFVLCLSLSP